MADDKIAVIRIRGETGIKGMIKDTLTMLNLSRKHACVIVPKTRSYLGMIHKVKDYVTYGEISEEALKLLDSKRKKEGKKSYALSPPVGGFERKGIKTSFTQKGALGYRGAKINDLIKRMV